MYNISNSILANLRFYKLLYCYTLKKEKKVVAYVSEHVNNTYVDV